LEAGAVKLVPVTVKAEEASPSTPAAERREAALAVEVGATRIVALTAWIARLSKWCSS
jgi:hypothetical protein